MISLWAGELGKPYAEFWHLTPKLFSLIVQGAAKRFNHEFIAGLQTAYVAEGLARSKKLPPLQELTGRFDQPEKAPARKPSGKQALMDNLLKTFGMFGEIKRG